MVEISVVVPVFNVEKYLSECLDSIINQTFKDIEILCINDGSTDNSLNILNKYMEIDNRIKIINQENSGLGASRNRGMELAKGKYIFFIDSDDYIELNTLMELYEICENKELDFVICQVKNYDEENGEFFTSDYFDMPILSKTVQDNVFNYKDVSNILPNINVVAWNKLYNLNFIKKSGARFSEDLIFEDNVFFWNLLFSAARIYFYQKYLYIYRRRVSSITSSGSKNLIDTIEIHNQIFDVFKKYGVFEAYEKFLFNKKVSLIFIRFEEISEEYKELFFSEMKKDWILMVQEYGKEKILNLLDERTSAILNNVLESEGYVELLLKNEIYHNKNTIGKLNNENKELKNKLNDCKKRNADLNNKLKLVYSSNSWRFTKPLRKIRPR